MTIFYEFESVDAFTTGTIGRPGERVFFLQARLGGKRVEVRCEKQQVEAVTQYLVRILNDLPPAEDKPIPAALDLTTPVEDVFVLGPIGLGYDRESDRLVIQLEEYSGNEEPDDDADIGHIRVFLTRGQAVAFCERADQVISSGRPSCPWCDLPIDPDGHACPRMN